MGSRSSKTGAVAFISQDELVAEVNLFPRLNASQESGEAQPFEDEDLACEEHENSESVKVENDDKGSILSGDCLSMQKTNSLPPIAPREDDKEYLQNAAVTEAAMTADAVDFKYILLSYKKKHRSSYVYLSECEKIVRGLQFCETNGQLASEAAFFKADQLAAFYVKVSGEREHRGEHAEVVMSFMIDVGLPQILIQSMGSLSSKYPDALFFDREKDVSSQLHNKQQIQRVRLNLVLKRNYCLIEVKHLRVCMGSDKNL